MAEKDPFADYRAMEERRGDMRDVLGVPQTSADEYRAKKAWQNDPERRDPMREEQAKLARMAYRYERDREPTYDERMAMLEDLQKEADIADATSANRALLGDQEEMSPWDRHVGQRNDRRTAMARGLDRMGSVGGGAGAAAAQAAARPSYSVSPGSVGQDGAPPSPQEVMDQPIRNPYLEEELGPEFDPATTNPYTEQSLVPEQYGINPFYAPSVPTLRAGPPAKYGVNPSDIHGEIGPNPTPGFFGSDHVVRQGDQVRESPSQWARPMFGSVLHPGRSYPEGSAGPPPRRPHRAVYDPND